MSDTPKNTVTCVYQTYSW